MGNTVYKEKYQIASSDCDNDNRMKISRLFDIMHDAADHAQISMKLDKNSLLENGFLWVLAEQTLEIERFPELGEEIFINTWVGKEFAMFIPRYYEIEIANGDTIVRASAVWAVLSTKDRKTIIPSKHEIILPITITGRELKILNTPKPIKDGEIFDAEVIHNYIDFNNHMNNAKYFDMISEKMPICAGKKNPKKIIARYSREAFLGDQLKMRIGKQDQSIFCSVDSDKGNHFKSWIEY